MTALQFFIIASIAESILLIGFFFRYTSDKKYIKELLKNRVLIRRLLAETDKENDRLKELNLINQNLLKHSPNNFECVSEEVTNNVEPSKPV